MANRNEPDDLDRRRRDLEAALAAKKPEKSAGGEGATTGGTGGYGNALRLSSEFIAGILVGAGLGWFIDRLAGTSPRRRDAAWRTRATTCPGKVGMAAALSISRISKPTFHIETLSPHRRHAGL